MLLVAGAVALAWALNSIANILLVLFVALFGVAVLSPVVTAMERRFRAAAACVRSCWCSATVLIVGAVLLVMVQAVSGAVEALSGDVPQILDEVRQSGLGSLIDNQSGAFEALKGHARDITSSVGTRFGRCRSHRGLGLRGHHARRLHRRPDTPRAGRRASRAAPNRAACCIGTTASASCG